FTQELSMHDHRRQGIVQLVRDIGEQRSEGCQLFTLVECFLLPVQLDSSPLPFYDPSELGTDLHQSSAQGSVGLLPRVSVELTHPYNLAVDQNGKSKTGRKPGFLCAAASAERHIRNHIHTPLWLAGGNHAPNGALSRRAWHGLCGLLKRREARWWVE